MDYNSDIWFIYINENKLHLNIIVQFSATITEIISKWRVASLQLPAKYLQLPAVMIGQTETLIGRICLHKHKRSDLDAAGEMSTKPKRRRFWLYVFDLSSGYMSLT